MLPRDDIFDIIKTFRTPISRGNSPISHFLNEYYKKYITSLESLICPKNRFVDEDVYKSINDNIGVVKSLCLDIIKVYDLYDQGFMEDVYKEFDKLMEQMTNYIFTRKLDVNHFYDKYYRIRTVDFDYELKIKDLFHIPMHKREYIKAYRYSIAGYPCLYLATSIGLCWFECGMPKKFNLSEYRFLPKDNNPILLIDFSTQPIDLISAITTNYLNNRDKDILNDVVVKYLFSYPLMAACSIEVVNKNAPFIQEYIFPQLLLLWIRKTDKYAGVCYKTASSIEAARQLNSYNIALPAKQINSEGYCSKLADMFKISKPLYCDLSQIFITYKDKVEKVRIFTSNLEHQYLNEYAFYPYREVLSLCKSFTKVYDCIVSENYSDPEVLYQAMDTLNLFAYFLTDNIESIISRSTKEAKHIVHCISEDEIKEKINKMFKEFKTEVKNIIFDFWGYEIRIDCSVNIADGSFSYLY